MLAIREEKMNMVNGGIGLAGLIDGLIGGPKFQDGDWVMSKSQPDAGVGVVVGKEYHEGWYYLVAMEGGRLYAPESDLEYAITK